MMREESLHVDKKRNTRRSASKIRMKKDCAANILKENNKIQIVMMNENLLKLKVTIHCHKEKFIHLL